MEFKSEATSSKHIKTDAVVPTLWFLKSIASISVGLLLLVPSYAYADNLSSTTDSANDLGRANSGRVVNADDASVAFTNPALMTQFNSLTLSSNFSYSMRSAEFENDGSSNKLFFAPLGNDATGFLNDIPSFNINAIYPLSENFVAGLAINTPFKQSSSFQTGTVARYSALDTTISTLNINPSIGFKISEHLSIGAGVSFQYAETEISNEINISASLARVLFCIQSPCFSFPDGQERFQGDSWTTGWNAGFVFHPNESLSLGLHYRSGIRHILDGDIDYRINDFALVLIRNPPESELYRDRRDQLELDLPASLNAGLKWALNDKITAYLDLTQTYWSGLNPLQVPLVEDGFIIKKQPQTLFYETTNRVAAGLDLKASSVWTVRSGIAYEQSPFPSQMTDIRIPDNDRITYAVGLTFQRIKSANIDLAYNFQDVETGNIDTQSPFFDHLRGKLHSRTHVFSVGMTKRF